MISVGDRFGKWTVISFSPESKRKSWICRCECGLEKPVREDQLNKAIACAACVRIRDMTGERFGKLTAIKRVGKNANNNSLWLCKCDCGNECVKNAGALHKGHAKSCGCVRIKTASNVELMESNREYNAKRAARRKELIAERIANGFVGYTHGENRTYRAGCRCDECTRASCEHAKAHAKSVKQSAKRKCGTAISWQQGCRCDQCVSYVKLRQKSRRYKISVSDLESMLKSHSMKCDVCGSSIQESWYIDHCHTTGMIRGLLCVKCNSGLGQFEDNITFMKSAIEYLCQNAGHIGVSSADVDATVASSLHTLVTLASGSV